MAALHRKRVVFALLAAVLSVFVSAVGLLAADLYLHRRYERSAGLNVWGYRGPTVGRKQTGEQRIVYLGGSTAFGYGVRWEEAIPAQLEKKLNEKQGGGSRRVSVVNLAYNNQGAYSFKFTLDDYLSLNYDVVCLYEGYNDLAGDDQTQSLGVSARLAGVRVDGLSTDPSVGLQRKGGRAPAWWRGRRNRRDRRSSEDRVRAQPGRSRHGRSARNDGLGQPPAGSAIRTPAGQR